MIVRPRVAASIMALLVVCATPAIAQGGKSASKTAKAAAPNAPGQTSVLANAAEIRIIREYYSATGPRPKPLPPGIAKNLARGKPVPPGLMRARVPDDLLAKLPPREGYQWAVANNVVLLLDAKGIVRDILREIF